MAAIKFYKQTTVPAPQSPDGVYFVQASKNDPFQIYVVHAGQAIALQATVGKDLQAVLETGNVSSEVVFLHKGTAIEPSYSFNSYRDYGMFVSELMGTPSLAFSADGVKVIDLLDAGVYVNVKLNALAGIEITGDTKTNGDVITGNINTTNSTSSIMQFSSKTYGKIMLKGSFTGNRTVQISNMDPGSCVEMFIENLSASSRIFTFQGSATTSGFIDFNISRPNGTFLNPSIVIPATSMSGTCLYIKLTRIGSEFIAYSSLN
jgi:hypothetical protein